MGTVRCRPPWARVVWCGLRVKTARNRLNQAWHRVHRTCEQPNTGAGAAGRMTPQLQVARREVLGGVQRRAARRPEFRPRGPRTPVKRIQGSIRIEIRARGSQVARSPGKTVEDPRLAGGEPRREDRPVPAVSTHPAPGMACAWTLHRGSGHPSGAGDDRGRRRRLGCGAPSEALQNASPAYSAFSRSGRPVFLWSGSFYFLAGLRVWETRHGHSGCRVCARPQNTLRA